MLAGRDRHIGRYAWAMAWVGLVGGQLHALARHRTTEGVSDLDQPLTAAWAEPAGELFSPLLDWASPDTVYLTYGKLWLPVFIGIALCAVVVRRRREPAGAEKWAWRVALTGYVLACVGVAAQYWTQWVTVDEALLETVFLALLPALLITVLGSTFLGVTLLLRGAPRLPAALLVAAVPSLFVIPLVTSLGNVFLPIAFAFGILGRRIARADAPTATPRPVPAAISR